MKIPKTFRGLITLPDGAKILKRYRNGKCWAAAFSADLNERQIRSRLIQGEAPFFPYDEQRKTFDWSRKDNNRSKPLRFRR